MSVAPAQRRVLSRLYLTLFLRGRASRGITRSTVPRSVPAKLALTLFGYALVGLSALLWLGQPVLVLAVFLHVMTFFFVGTFITASAGDMLFERHEADILLHRPIEPRALLLGKVSALVRVSLWMAAALNLAGTLLSLYIADSAALFICAHVFSTLLQALFVAGVVVLVYELCLRWFGRERLDAVITFAQVLVALGIAFAYQVPNLVQRFQRGTLSFDAWWWWLVPPFWFAAIDDALAGSGSVSAWLGAALAGAVTALVLVLAFGKLAGTYAEGVGRMSEAGASKSDREGARRWFDRVMNSRLLRLWLRDPAGRVTFFLCGAYLARDREIKLRVYPGLVAVVILPLLSFISTGDQQFASFQVAFAGAFVGLDAMLAVGFLGASQQYRAAEIFRQVPLSNPGPLARGVRAAVFVLMILPLVIIICSIVGLAYGAEILALLVPGLLAAPAFARVPFLDDYGAPFSQPVEDGKAASHPLRVAIASLVSVVIAGLATWAWLGGWYLKFSIYYTLVAVLVTLVLELAIRRSSWSDLD